MDASGGVVRVLRTTKKDFVEAFIKKVFLFCPISRFDYGPYRNRGGDASNPSVARCTQARKTCLGGEERMGGGEVRRGEVRRGVEDRHQLTEQRKAVL